MPKVIKRKEADSASASSSRPTKPPRRSGHSGGRGRKPIIEKEIVGAEKEARRILAEARTQAQQIIDQAKHEGEEIRQRAHQEGYEEGLGQHTEQTTQALLQVEQMKASIEPEYIKLVTACVEKIIGKELRTEPRTIVSIVRAALKDATQQREINVRVNPDDVDTLRSNQRRLFDVLARAGNVEIREDDSVRRGGCIVVTELGTIDASLDRQLAALEVALQDELNSSEEDESETGEYDEESY
ncbi:MAG: type III secretion system stator protein SctL [Myxococcota bacterium]|nr:type III secretion system stator protein SctL [Myxococcota bacterium]